MHLKYRAPDNISTVIDSLVEDRVAFRIGGSDATIWGKAAEEEAAQRLAWVDLPETSRPLLAEIEALQAELAEEGLTRVVLAGMGGSSLAPEVICAANGVPLITLDTTDPGQVAAAFSEDLDKTVVVVSSKSGGTVETDSHRRAAEKFFTDAGIDPRQRIIIVTDPGSPLQQTATDAGYRKVFLANPNVGGRYSALTAFGLVPSGLAGADIAELLDDAAGAHAALIADEPSNPALILGAVIGVASRSGSEKLVMAEAGTANRGFADWAEQLVAESTGKDSKGILPVVVEGTSAPGYADAGPDTVLAALGTVDPPAGGGAFAVASDGPLGAQFLLWEMATAVAGAVVGINPFDQPNVEEAKVQARRLLDAPGDDDPVEPLFTDGAVQGFSDSTALRGASDVADAVRRLLDTTPQRGYVAVMAYLDRHADSEADELRAAVATRTGRQTTFGWGPRFLHSTGQYHKGGHQNGVFLQITADCSHDLAIPGRPYSFHTLQLAQASGDAAVLAAKGRPVLRLHLTDRAAGLRQILDAVRAD